MFYSLFITSGAKLLNADWLKQRAFFLYNGGLLVIVTFENTPEINPELPSGHTCKKKVLIPRTTLHKKRRQNGEQVILTTLNSSESTLTICSAHVLQALQCRRIIIRLANNLWMIPSKRLCDIFMNSLRMMCYLWILMWNQQTAALLWLLLLCASSHYETMQVGRFSRFVSPTSKESNMTVQNGRFLNLSQHRCYASFYGFLTLLHMNHT